MSLNFGQGLFPPRGESLINYDWVDTSSGTGFVEYYLFKSASDYKLSNNLVYCNDVTSFQTNNGGATVLLQDIDFDVLFNKPQTVKGTAVFNMTHGWNMPTGGNATAYLIIKIRKWDGSSETEIANATGTTFSMTPSGAGWKLITDCIEIVIPQTHFKSGETLRVTVEQWGAAQESASEFVIAHDPKNRAVNARYPIAPYTIAFGVNPSIALIQIPFRIQL